jgi:FkbM family methyltransferase
MTTARPTPTDASMDKLDAANQSALAAIKAGSANSRDNPYFGYVLADIFDCPPFYMFTNNDCPRSDDILFARSFEPGSMAAWCRLARKATAVLDIGAQVGVYALAAASLRPDIAIHAFEPNPFAAARLRMNKYVNKFMNIGENYVAVGAENKQNVLAWRSKGPVISSGSSVGSFAAEWGDQAERALVFQVTIDSLGVNLGDRGLIKIDVEGAELAVFRGMTASLNSVPDILVESFSEKACLELNKLILPLGYRVYRIVEKTGQLIPQDRLLPMDRTGQDFNQLLSVRPQ